MTLLQGPFRTAILFLLISAALHLFAFLVGGFSAEALQLIPIGFLYVLLAFGLAKGWRWLAYVVFIGLFIGAIVGLTFVWSPSPIPGWWFAAIVIADLLCVGALFIALWRRAPMVEA